MAPRGCGEISSAIELFLYGVVLGVRLYISGWGVPSRVSQDMYHWSLVFQLDIIYLKTRNMDAIGGDDPDNPGDQPVLLTTASQSDPAIETAMTVNSTTEQAVALQTVYTNLTPVTIQDESGLRQVAISLPIG